MSLLHNQLTELLNKTAISLDNTEMKFKKDHDFEYRKREALKIMNKYPDRIPVIVEKSPHENHQIPCIDKSKFLVPNDLSIGQFLYVIRRRIKLQPEKALFLFVGRKTIAPTSEVMVNVYEKHKDQDGFLYMIYSGENSFG